MTNEHAAQRVEELRREGRFEAAVKLAEAQTITDLEPGAARELLVSIARVHREYGRWSTAAACMEEAARLGDADPWLDAEAYVDRYWHASLGTSAEVLREQAAVHTALAEELAGRAASVETASLYWAIAAIGTGLHPDDAPSGDDLDDAERALASAETMAPDRHRVQLTRLRLEWVKARKADDRRQAVAQAFETLSTLSASSSENGSGGHELLVGLSYIEGRLHLLDRNWSRARELFQTITGGLQPGHQAAHVWSIYCDRILTNGHRDLLLNIDALLRPELRDGAGPRRADGKDAVVVAPHLESELLRERAAIVEDREPDRARLDYQTVLERRPRMTFAQRALLRCEVAAGRSEEAATSGEQLLRAAREERAHNGTPLPTDVIAEVGRIKLGLHSPDEASDLFRESIGAAPSYAFAHAGLVRARTEARDYDGAVAAGDEARRSVGPRGWAEVSLELGHVHLAREEFDQAIDYFAKAAEDESLLVADRAKAGLIHTHMTMGRLRRALELTDISTVLPGTYMELQTGWLHSEVGEYGVALECFKNAQDQLPRSVTAIRGQARTLRLLGCFHSATAFLEEKRETLPADRRGELDIERAWSALELGDEDTATRLFNRAVNSSQAESAHRGRIAVAGRTRATPTTIKRLAQEAFDALGHRPAAIYAETGAALLRAQHLPESGEWFRLADKQSSGAGGKVLKLYVVHEYITARALAEAEVAISGMEVETPSHAVDDPRINLARARMLLAGEDPDGALERYQAVLRDWPNNAVALLGAAMAAFRCEDLLARDDQPGKRAESV